MKENISHSHLSLKADQNKFPTFSAMTTRGLTMVFNRNLKGLYYKGQHFIAVTESPPHYDFYCQEMEQTIKKKKRAEIYGRLEDKQGVPTN